MSLTPTVLRTWRVSMKDGSTRVVTADKLEPTGNLGLSFIRDGVAVAGLAYATYTEWAEIDQATGETLHVKRIAAPEGSERATWMRRSSETRPETGTDKGQIIRETPAGTAYCEQHEDEDDIARLIATMDISKRDGEPLKEIRAAFLENVGGFPPKTYKRFNAALAAAIEKKLVETL